MTLNFAKFLKVSLLDFALCGLFVKILILSWQEGQITSNVFHKIGTPLYFSTNFKLLSRKLAWDM